MTQDASSDGRIWWRVGVMALAGWLAVGCALAAEPAVENKGQPVAGADTSPLDGLIFVPHDYQAPEVTESGGARSAQQANTGLPNVFVLAPPRLARTFSTQPTLYWYITGPSDAPVRFTLQDLDATAPLLEVDLGPAPTPGIHATSLAEHGVRLESDRLYQWSVALAVTPGSFSEEPVAKTIFRTEEADAGLLQEIESAPPIEQVRILAEHGYWYDALALISGQISAGDREQSWRELRASLLEQIGLTEVAGYDRTAAGAG